MNNTAPLVAAVAAIVAVTGCSSPLSSRRAQVLTPGELEVSVVPYLEASTALTKGAAPSGAPLIYPFAEATARIGVVERVDMQLKFDPTVVPEVNVAVQVVGDPRAEDDFAFTLSLGLKPTALSILTASAGVITAPVQAIADVPLGHGTALVLGARVIPAVTFQSAGLTGQAFYSVAPGGFVALHVPLGETFFVRPEVAANGLIPFGDNTALGLGTANVAVALGVGGTFDFTRGPSTPPK